MSNPEQASAVDVEMKDANGVANPPGSEEPPKSGSAGLQTSSAAVDVAVGTAAKGTHVGNVAKLESADKKDRENIVNEDLLRAFRYFDKTGKHCCERPWRCTLIGFVSQERVWLVRWTACHQHCAVLVDLRYSCTITSWPLLAVL